MKQYREKRQTSQMITPPVIMTLSLQEDASETASAGIPGSWL